MNPPARPRRILHLVGTAEDNGGILSSIRAIAAASDPAAWEHVLWVNSAFLQSRKPQLHCRYSPHALDETPSALRFLLAAWRAWPDLKRLLAAERFPIIHAHSRGAFPLAVRLARSGVPVLFTNHAYARRTGMYRAATRHPAFRTILLTPNQARHYGLSPQPGRVDVISEAGAERYFEEPLSPRPPLHDRPLQIVGIGNVVAWKKWDLLLDALHRLPEALRHRVQATIWGPVPADPAARQYSEELRAAIQRYGMQSHFRLAGPTSEVLQILGRADWFILPSTNEPCSVALIEALAMGVPALVSNSGGNPDIVRDGVTGALFQPDSGADLSRRLESILTGGWRPAPPGSIRESVRERAASRVARQYEALYESVLAAGTSGTVGS